MTSDKTVENEEIAWKIIGSNAFAKLGSKMSDSIVNDIKEALDAKDAEIQRMGTALNEIMCMISRDNPDNEWEKGYTAAVLMAQKSARRQKP